MNRAGLGVRPDLYLLPRQAAGQEAFELAAPHRMLKFANRLGFNLPNTFSRHFEDSADFFKRVGVAVADAVAELDDLALAVRQRLKHPLDLVLEYLLRGRFNAVVAEIAVITRA